MDCFREFHLKSVRISSRMFQISPDSDLETYEANEFAVFIS